MSLIACPECGKQVSTRAKTCPNCGAPVEQPANGGGAIGLTDNSAVVPDLPSAQEVLLAIRRSFWDISGHALIFALVLPILIYFVPADWWRVAWPLPVLWVIALVIVGAYKRYSFVMNIYADRVSVVEGFFAKETSEFFIKDIRSIDVRQGFWGRIVNIGNVTISTAATIDAAEEAHGVAHPRKIKDLLISLRQKSMA